MPFRPTPVVRPVQALVLAAVLPLVAASMAGCSGTMTYINVPGDGKDVAGNNANTFNVRKVETLALQEAILRWTPKAPFTILLPDGTRRSQYQDIVDAIAHPMLKMPDEVPADAPVFEVSAVRLRGGDGVVDVVHPGGLRPRELVEVHVDLRTDENGTGWRVDHILERKLTPPLPIHKAPARPVEPAEEPKSEPKSEPQPAPEAPAAEPKTNG